MTTYAEALSILCDAASQLSIGAEILPISQAAGRVAADRIASPEPLPLFNNSAMDGFALKAAGTKRAPVRLPVQGSIAAGDVFSAGHGAGTYEIMTGAPIPEGCDAVVPIEGVNLLDAGRTLEVLEPAKAGDYVRLKGSDLPAGAPVIEPGTMLDERHVLVLASLGITQVKVRRKIKAAVFSTGKELVPAQDQPKPGQVRNATGPYLLAALTRAGAQASWQGISEDHSERFLERLGRAVKENPDLIVSTGAVSMGRHDFIPSAVAQAGGRTLFHRVAMRPGKPIFAARLPDGPLFIGLPGNPVSTVVALRFFITAVLRVLQGQGPEKPRVLPLAQAAAKPEGMRCFYKARLKKDEVLVLTGQASFQIKPLLDADCWAVLPEAGSMLKAGSLVEVFAI
ncbi:MAG TPA: molybdopterin molybdenumtransferase MoeA [Elusimicrobia bacterium]|nr:molybdopterin molybdenumtransferase MoeA [Elusimicrobiota bacterium]HBT60715.1 molybdopterin molybdenumtransferase MoeA [Elusimicrobiota bacterium]